ncbi:MAG TPA: HDOD domain-containing protein [Tepidisphaeraceae bacterium]
MKDALISRIRQCPTLPSLPAVAIQVLELAQREEVDIAEIARIISKDPALSSKILRTVNSSFYGRSQSISTITHALVILGLQSVKTLVLGFSLVTNLAKNKSKGFKHLNYWRRSIYAATAARTLAAKTNVVQQEECFLVALLMDIGMLVLDQVVADQYGELNEPLQSHNDLAAAELNALGLTHADAAQVLATQWKLPPLLSTPMAMHHRPKDVQDPALKKITDVVWLAGRCADVFVDEVAADAIAEVRRFCFEEFQMPPADCDTMMDEICKRTKEVAPLFEISIASATSYEAILKKANEALVDITLKSQQQASTLQEQNQQLKHQALTDGLTSLANRARFDEFIAQQFASAVKEGKPLALLMLDVDKFKLVNDKYGHQSGDTVLRALGALLRTATRSQDLAARYGGEEMVLVLPGTTRATAAAIAESVRRAIAAKPILCDRIQLKITASIGVAVYEPGSPLKQPAHLIKAADMAVYAAKHGGRNCVRVFALKAQAA